MDTKGDGTGAGRGQGDAPGDGDGEQQPQAEYSYDAPPATEAAAGAEPAGASADGEPADGAPADRARQEAADPAQPTGQHPVTDQETGTRSSTGVHTGTAPRAVLRPVPEGFPTPPPRPARPNRAPAPQGAPEEPRRRRRGPLIAALVVVAVLVLVVGVSGSILAYRALTPDPAGPGPSSSAPSDPGTAGQSGEATIGAVTVAEVSTEVGVRQVGDAGSAIEPEGEFAILTLEITNDTEQPLSFEDRIMLETEDGETHEAAPEATRRHLADSESFGIIDPGQTLTVHQVFDVPVGSSATAARIDFTDNPDAGEGTLVLPG